MSRLAYLTISTEIGCFCSRRNIIKREKELGKHTKEVSGWKRTEMAQEEGEIKSLNWK